MAPTATATSVHDDEEDRIQPNSNVGTPSSTQRFPRHHAHRSCHLQNPSQLHHNSLDAAQHSNALPNKHLHSAPLTASASAPTQRPSHTSAQAAGNRNTVYVNRLEKRADPHASSVENHNNNLVPLMHPIHHYPTASAYPSIPSSPRIARRTFHSPQRNFHAEPAISTQNTGNRAFAVGPANYHHRNTSLRLRHAIDIGLGSQAHIHARTTRSQDIRNFSSPSPTNPTQMDPTMNLNETRTAQDKDAIGPFQQHRNLERNAKSFPQQLYTPTIPSLRHAESPGRNCEAQKVGTSGHSSFYAQQNRVEGVDAHMHMQSLEKNDFPYFSRSHPTAGYSYQSPTPTPINRSTPVQFGSNYRFYPYGPLLRLKPSEENVSLPVPQETSNPSSRSAVWKRGHPDIDSDFEGKRVKTKNVYAQTNRSTGDSHERVDEAPSRGGSTQKLDMGKTTGAKQSSAPSRSATTDGTDGSGPSPSALLRGPLDNHPGTIETESRQQGKQNRKGDLSSNDVHPSVPNDTDGNTTATSNPGAVGFECPDSACKRRFETESLRDMHARGLHWDKEKRSCGLCGTTLDTYAALELHVWDKHERVAPRGKPMRFACNKCPALFISEEDRRRHVQSTHSRRKAFECSMCNVSFKSRADLIQHINVCDKDE